VIASSLVMFLAAALQDDMDIEGALLRFRKGYASPLTANRVAAVSELARITHEKSAGKLVQLLTTDVKEVRIAAAKGLAGFPEQKKVAVASLINALQANSKEIDVQCAIYEALAKLQDPLGLQVIHQGFRDPQIRVAKGAIAAAGVGRQKESLDALNDLMTDVQKWIQKNQGGGYIDGSQAGDNAAKKARLEDLQKSIIAALQAITREKWGSVKEWEVWFRRYRADFEVPK
jgi:HEAT repeat protein